MTFPRAVGQVPLYYNHLNTGRPPKADNRYTSKYIDVPWEPLFPFGHGLSYTHFRLSNLRLERKAIAPDGQLGVTVDVENIGEPCGRRGRPALYPRRGGERRASREGTAPASSGSTLRPGEKRTVRFELGPERLGFYNREMKFVVEPGEFRVFVGTSSVGGLEERFDVVNASTAGR